MLPQLHEHGVLLYFVVLKKVTQQTTNTDCAMIHEATYPKGEFPGHKLGGWDISFLEVARELWAYVC